ncbi:hypothetical protein ASC70_01275 [Caulobacter sp. Root343]|nr:hypothetical protein ASC62_10325 [Caulobacter sp. Root342]KQV72578.1 hypothetical protein ASC70_01275 [Caulobacter sp. Root343]
MRSRVGVKQRSFPTGLFMLGLLTCGILFWMGGLAADQLSGGLSIVAILAAFVAVCVGPVLLVITVLWGGFAFFRWLWSGGRE